MYMYIYIYIYRYILDSSRGGDVHQRCCHPIVAGKLCGYVQQCSLHRSDPGAVVESQIEWSLPNRASLSSRWPIEPAKSRLSCWRSSLRTRSTLTRSREATPKSDQNRTKNWNIFRQHTKGKCETFCGVLVSYFAHLPLAAQNIMVLPLSSIVSCEPKGFSDEAS